MTDFPIENALAVFRLDLVRFLILAGVICTLAIAVALDLGKECRRGALSSALSRGFDVKRCDLVIRWTGEEIARIPLPKASS